MKTWVRGAMLLAILAPSLTGTARAQRLMLTLNSGTPIAFPAVTEAMYDAGLVPATAAVAFTVDLTSGSASNRTFIVSIRSTSSVMGGTKPIGDLQWRRSDLATWTNMTTTDVTVETRPIVRNGLNDPWSNSIFFRAALSWSNDGPATYAPTIVMTVTLTTP